VRGKLVFRADETAAPFELHTPSATLVDYGTEYAVAVGPEGEEVHVFEGEVRRIAKTAATPEQLKTGEARRYSPTPAAPGQPTALNAAHFVRTLAGGGARRPGPGAGGRGHHGLRSPDA